MSQTDKAFIKAFRHGPSTPRPTRRPVAAPPSHAPADAYPPSDDDLESPAETAPPRAAQGRPTAMGASSGAAASAPEPASPAVDADRLLSVIERAEDERPGEPILSFEEARLLRGDEVDTTVAATAPPAATPELRASASASSMASAEVKPVVEAKPLRAPTTPARTASAPVSAVATPEGPTMSGPAASGPTLAAAAEQEAAKEKAVLKEKPLVGDAPAARPTRGLQLRTLADFTEEASSEEPWAVRRKVETFEMPGVCQSLLAARGSDFHRLAQELHARREKGLKTLWVGSCQGNEGATSFAVCLAHVLGKQGVESVLVDHDLTNPGVADMLRLTPDQGWREVLTGEAALPDALWQSAAGWSVLPLRGDNAAPLSGSQLLRLRLSMALLRRRFDLVVLDAGPFRLVGDEEMTYPQPDAAILVYDPQATTPDELGKQADRLASRQIDLLGAVENFSLHESEGKVA